MFGYVQINERYSYRGKVLSENVYFLLSTLTSSRGSPSLLFSSFFVLSSPLSSLSLLPTTADWLLLRCEVTVCWELKGVGAGELTLT